MEQMTEFLKAMQEITDGSQAEMLAKMDILEDVRA
jgi:hypothetical protein